MAKRLCNSIPEDGYPWPPPGLARAALLVFLFLMVVPDLPAAQQTMVRVMVPQSVSGEFDIFIDIKNAVDLDSGQFDLVYNPDAIQINRIDNGAMGETVVPVDLWSITSPGRVRVLFNFPGVQGISGAGHLAKIRASAIGKQGTSQVFAIDKGLLVDREARGIPARWLEGKADIKGCVEKAGAKTGTQSGQAAEVGPISGGMTLSTPVALTGLLMLGGIPALILVLLRKRNRKN